MSASCIKQVQEYVKLMMAVPGMKALVMDRATTGIISMVFTQSDLIAHEVYITELIDLHKPDENAQLGSIEDHEERKAVVSTPAHMKAIVFIRPVASSVHALKMHLVTPRFKEYHVFFSNILNELHLNTLGEADDYKVVKSFQEHFADYYAVNPDVLTLNLFRARNLYKPQQQWRDTETHTFIRTVEGVLAMCLSFKKKPLIRYSRSSELAKLLAVEVTRRINQDSELFSFGNVQTGVPLLVILDRRDDPITPLLTQWTYQALLHEILGIRNGRVDLTKAPGIRNREDVKNTEVVVSCADDPFWSKNMYSNYGDLVLAVKELVAQYSKKVQSTKKLETIEDIQRFVESAPEFFTMASNVGKHANIAHELARLVDERKLLNVSEVEQEIVAGATADGNSAAELVLKLWADSYNPNDPAAPIGLNHDDMGRTLILYALRFDGEPNCRLDELKQAFLEHTRGSVEAQRMHRALDSLLEFAGPRTRGRVDAGSKPNILAAGAQLMKQVKGVTTSFLTGGPENVFTQHKPVLHAVLQNIQKRSLKVGPFPFADGSSQNEGRAHEDVFVFIIGGVTYEEALFVHHLNASRSGLKIVLGGSCIHNSDSYLADILSEDRFSADDMDTTELGVNKQAMEEAKKEKNRIKQGGTAASSLSALISRGPAAARSAAASATPAPQGQPQPQSRTAPAGPGAGASRTVSAAGPRKPINNPAAAGRPAVARPAAAAVKPSASGDVELDLS